MTKILLCLFALTLLTTSCRKDDPDFTINMVGTYDMQIHSIVNCGACPPEYMVDTIYHSNIEVKRIDNALITIGNNEFKVNEKGSIIETGNSPYSGSTVGHFFKSDSVKYWTSGAWSGSSWNYSYRGKKID